MTDKTAPRHVLLGIVDDGIAFVHERFRLRGGGRLGADRTRVEYMWVQDGVKKTPNSPVLYGREITKRQIDNLLFAYTKGGAVDEDRFYRAAGLFDFRRGFHQAATWRAAHGTHAMDIACGFDPEEQRVDRPIIAVQLPAGATADTSGAALDPHALDAIQYILDRALAIRNKPNGREFPVVINFSYGLIAGPHDGTSDLEQAIHEAVTRHARIYKTDVQVVLPAGNSYLSRCHAQASLRPDGRATLRWRVQPDDRTPSIMQIWLPFRMSGTDRGIELQITSPTGEAHTIAEKLGSAGEWPQKGAVHARAQYVMVPAPTDRGMFEIRLHPTATHRDRVALAPAGLWTIELTNRGDDSRHNVHAWIQRDESLYGYPRRGRQSYFDHRDYVRYDHAGREVEIDDASCAVKRASLISAIATGPKETVQLNGETREMQTIVIGGYVRREDVVAKYSAGGPTVPPRGTSIANRDGPDALAPSEDTVVHRGILAAGSRSGSVVTMSGTSVAAPRVARMIADEIAAGRSGDGDAVKRRARADEQGRPDRPPPERGGAGRLKLEPIVKLRRYEE